MKRLRNIILVFIFPTICFPQQQKFSQQQHATVEAMASTFNFNGDTLGGGTCFMISKGGNQYFVTASHLFKASDMSGDVIPIDLLNQNQLETFNAKVYFHPDRNVDIAVFKLPKKITQGPGLSLDTTSLFPGMQVFFYGFPLSNMGTETPVLKFPLVKSAIISGMGKFAGVNILLLDGHNNHGFSGGPVLVYDTTKKAMCIVGVISSYYFEPRNVSYKGDRLSFDENSGIVICYWTRYIEEILEQNK